MDSSQTKASSPRRKPAFLNRVILFAAPFILAGCGTVNLHPLTQDELARGTAADLAAARQDVEPIVGPLSLDEAIARALKYNLDRRVKMMEEALALDQLDTASWDMLPRLMAQAGYSHRNKDLITDSTDSVTGEPSLSHPYISTARTHKTYDLGLTWNLLDFGLSYIEAKQQADRVLIAGERRRKAMHVLVQDVRTAFWRTVSAQKLHDQVARTIAVAEGALQDSEKVQAERLRAPIDALRYQRQLLESLNLLEGIQLELDAGHIELAQLINAPLDQDFRVEEPSDKVDTVLRDMPVKRMEELALTQNADIREQHYASRIASEETWRTMLKLFPNLSVNFGVRHDTDSYLINKTWNETGMQLSWNVFNLLSASSRKKLADAGVKLADQRRIATQMAVLAKVHLSRLAYEAALNQYQRADQISRADAQIAEQTRNRAAAETQSKLQEVSEHTVAILSLLRRYQSLSQLQNASGKLQATMGMEPAIGSVSELSLQALTREVATSMENWRKGVADEVAPQVAVSAAAH
ncbi:TolC family protein [Achromobacter aloeverae]|uniref:Transporter n=1 Tax=Achromobacter aloeverae TaxID=1750518 RepID=A0A4Q1HJZ3_9BURK|nr:TolC family protein [Achromobacter aloeverae]RXN90331.1 transporter [Achromobacter aloeverae]